MPEHDGNQARREGLDRSPARLGRLSPLRSGSREDMGNFVNAYVENEVFTKNPFASLDQSGVGQLVKIAIEKGRKTRPDIKLGI